MNANQNNVGRGFWLWWVLASAIGFGVGAIPAAAVSSALFPQNAFNWGVLFGLLFGAVGGLAQWLVLRKQLLEVGLWAPASALGFIIATGIGASIGQQVASNSIARTFLFAAIIGPTGGLMQWLILRRQGVTVGWWLAASVLGSLLGITLGIPLINAPWSKMILFGFGAAFGVGLGLITGVPLVWMLRHPKSGPGAEAATQGAR